MSEVNHPAPHKRHGWLFRLLVRLLSWCEGAAFGLPPSTIQTGVPGDGAVNVPINPTVTGTSDEPGCQVNGYVFTGGNYKYANSNATADNHGNWSLSFSGLSYTTGYVLKTFIVSTTDPAACLSGFTTMPKPPHAPNPQPPSP